MKRVTHDENGRFSGYVADPKLPYQALVDFVGKEVDTKTFAAAVGFNLDVVGRWRRGGGLPLSSGERAAHTLGVHPTAIWPVEYYEAIQPALTGGE